MTIRKKVEVEKVIEKGGHVAADLKDRKAWTHFGLRIKNEMLDDIGVAIEDIAGLTKTGFMLQAIQEKLKKMNQQNE